METTLVRKTWGEREGVSLEMLEKFTKPGDPDLGKVQTVWNYRGDGTATGDRRLQSLIGEEAYQHHHWDTRACNGGVMVVVPRWKSAEKETRSNLMLRAPYWWAMSEMAADVPEDGAGVRPATPGEIEAVVPETRELLSVLPGLEFRSVKRVSFFSTERPGKKQWQEAPQDVRYFRFAAGYGCVAIDSGSDGC